MAAAIDASRGARAFYVLRVWPTALLAVVAVGSASLGDVS